MKTKEAVVLVAFLLAGLCPVFGQEDMIDLFKNNRKTGNTYFQLGMYSEALSYFEVIKPKHRDGTLMRNIAYSYYRTKQYRNAYELYRQIIQTKDVEKEDIFTYAEILVILGDVESAKMEYRKLLEHISNDPVILKKIWQLEQRDLLYQDSSLFFIRSIEANSSLDDLNPTLFRGGLVFLSNRVDLRMSREEQLRGRPLQLWYAPAAQRAVDGFRWPVPVLHSFPGHRRFDGISIYREQKSAYAAGSHVASSDGSFKIQLFLTDLEEGEWTPSTSFTFNNPEFNLTQPCLSSDGTSLYFSADLPGGYGGFDLYKSEWDGTRWSPPVNLGENINTRYDECYPFVDANVLYFSSNGHPGLGGMDIFHVSMDSSSLQEVQNQGYPINSNADDVSIHFASASKGYFSSNRNSADFTFNIFEFGVSKQTFPIEISGTLFSKVSDSNVQLIMGNAPLQLIDIPTNEVIANTTSDSNGRFLFSIPRFSRYALRVADSVGNSYDVSLEIDPQHTNQSTYEIVVTRQWTVESDLTDYKEQR